jgi:hypothetical protein
MTTSLKKLTARILLGCTLVVVAGCSEHPLGLEAGDATLGADDRAPGSTDAAPQAYRIAARLVASDYEPRASGAARFEALGDRRHFSIEVAGLSVDGTGVVRVARGDRVLLTARIRIEGGAGRLVLPYAGGSPLPMMEPGDVVQVMRADGVPGLRGVFQRVR